MGYVNGTLLCGPFLLLLTYFNCSIVLVFEITTMFKYLLKTAEIFSVVLDLNWCVLLTCWIVFHFESSFCHSPIRFKLNHDPIAWWYMVGSNWSTTILSHHGWCTWSTIINGQGIPAEKIIYWFFSFDNYKEL